MGLIDSKWDLSPQFGEWDKVPNKEWEARCMEVYAAMVDNMDQGIGRIVQALKDNGKYDNTLVLFLEDNGGNYERVGREGSIARQDHPTLPPLGDDRIETIYWPKQTRDGYPVLSGPAVMPGPRDTYIAYGQGWANVSNTPFREYKHFVHEGGISTPLIAHWPDKITRKNQIENQPGHLIDLMATCVDLAGARYPKELNGQDITPMEGVSLAPAFAGKALPERDIFWEHEGNRAVREGKWKLVAKFPAGRWELYDMDADRTEMHDLAGAEPGRVADLKRKWETWAQRTHALPWPWKPKYGTVSDHPKSAVGDAPLERGK
ncbi:MAG TPA: sulfatase-like hydrolase/transferase [Tepidisphaeraceae bacterium]|nr:sulfatase-like hydrolase/transferase [Tepidisphaeraceae bacterium]